MILTRKSFKFIFILRDSNTEHWKKKSSSSLSGSESSGVRPRLKDFKGGDDAFYIHLSWISFFAWQDVIEPEILQFFSTFLTFSAQVNRMIRRGRCSEDCHDPIRWSYVNVNHMYVKRRHGYAKYVIFNTWRSVSLPRAWFFTLLWQVKELL